VKIKIKGDIEMQRDKKYKDNLDILNSIRSLPKITKKEFKQLIVLSKDKNSLVRGDAAKILLEKQVKNHASKKLLYCLARDKDELVRIDAYEGLQMFEIPEVELFFRRAIQTEKEELACWYAIISWVKAVLSLHDDHTYDINYIKWLLKQRKIQESEYCLLECYYTLYQFGELDIFPILLRFSESNDYIMHYVVFRILQDMVNEDNRERVIKAIEKVLENTYSMGLVKDALPYWKEMIVGKKNKNSERVRK